MPHRIRRFVVALMLTCSSHLFGLAAASPAQDLFDQAVYLLIVNYGGFSSVNPKSLEASYQPELDQVCAAQPETCSYKAAYPVIAKMVGAFQDAHTNFISAEVLNSLNGIVRGSDPGGKGFGLLTVPAKRSASRMVLDVMPNSPAAKAGLKRGDRIVAVNNRAVSRYKDIDALLAGAKGTARLLILRAGKSFVVALEPEILPAVPDPSLILRQDGLAVLRIPSFLLPGLAEKVVALLHEAQGQHARGLILDLRDNTGGLVGEYVRIAGEFIDDPGRVFDSQNPLRKQSLQFRDGQVGSGPLEVAKANPTRWTGPLVVLVNALSASASEFLAHDLQRYAKATVIGELTFGVGNTLTTLFSLEDGSGLQITLSKAVHPDGTTYPERITPDIALTDDLEVLNRSGHDALLERAVEALSK